MEFFGIFSVPGGCQNILILYKINYSNEAKREGK